MTVYYNLNYTNMVKNPKFREHQAYTGG